jgi:glucosylceramidase
VAFKTAQGMVLIVANRSPETKSFSVRFHGGSFPASLDPGAVGTFVW